MSLVWIIPALGVSLLTIAVVLQLLEDDASRLVARMNATAAAVLLLLEGSWVLFTSRSWSGEAALTTNSHGIAMLAAGAGIWAITYLPLSNGIPAHNSAVRVR